MIKKIMDLLTFAKARSDFGSQKYKIDSPGPGPWGDDPTIELFWFRNLPEDMREELADAQVYGERFIIRERTADIPYPARVRLEGLVAEYTRTLFSAYELTKGMTTVLEEHAPDLLEDREEMWGRHSPRLTFPAE